jgi:hypothetical protein
MEATLKFFRGRPRADWNGRRSNRINKTDINEGTLWRFLNHEKPA